MGRDDSPSRSHSAPKYDTVRLSIRFIERDGTASDLLAPSLPRMGHPAAMPHGKRLPTGQARSMHPDLVLLNFAAVGPSGRALSDAMHARLPRIATDLLLEDGSSAVSGAAQSFIVYRQSMSKISSGRPCCTPYGDASYCRADAPDWQSNENRKPLLLARQGRIETLALGDFDLCRMNN